VLEAVCSTILDARLAATKRVTGRIIVYGVAGGEATASNPELVYKHQIHIIGLNWGTLIPYKITCGLTSEVEGTRTVPALERTDMGEAATAQD
jgi:hypothetical protein